MTGPMLGTGQEKCYDVAEEIPCPAPGEPFHGQDAQFGSAARTFRTDGEAAIVRDEGLMWQRGEHPRGTWFEAVKYCAALRLGDYDDWRLPTDQELFSLLDFGRYSPAIDVDVFPATRPAFYWTSTDNTANEEQAWTVLFSYGYSFAREKSDASIFMRCVREAS